MAETFSFGEWVRKRRRALDLTQDELAQQIGCAVSTVRKIELDERRPSKQLAALLADGLNLPAGDRAAFLKAARAEGTVDRLMVPPITPVPHALPIEPPAQTRASHLPAPTTTLIGRAHDLAQLHAIAAQPGVRLVTLTGPGGTGKTRLALQFASERATAYADGVMFIDLAPLTDADQVLTTIAQLLGVRELIGTTLIERLRDYLQPRQLVLVLDNFEHLLVAAPIVADLLRAAPRLTVVVTSRVVLRLSGEHEYPVPPLAVPPRVRAVQQSDLALDRSTIAEYPAVQLFVERARAAQPAFALTEGNAAVVAEICRRLDGLPLAIELAAARIKLFTAEALLARLNDRLRLLTSGARDLPARQQALRATIDWSFHLLTPSEQRLFWRLAVFVGGWTIDAAEAICDQAGALGIAVMDGLQALVDHSLVRQETEPDGTSRFRRLETIGEYASELLIASGEAQVFRHHHAEYFCALAEEAQIHNYRATQEQWMGRLELEYDNLYAALVWSSEPSHSPAIALRLSASLLLFWVNRRPLTDGYHWLAVALAVAQDSTLVALRAKALCAAGNVAIYSADFQRGEALLTEALALFESLGDGAGCSEALNMIGISKQQRGALAQTIALQKASVERAMQAGSKVRAAWALVALARTYMYQGQNELSVRTYREIIASNVLQGDVNTHFLHGLLGEVLSQSGADDQAIVLLDPALPVMRVSGGVFANMLSITRARIAHAQGDNALAAALLYESMTRAYELSDANGLLHIHLDLGILDLEAHQLRSAHQHLYESLALCRTQPHPWVTAVALLGVGLCAVRLEDYVAALRAYRESVTLLHTWREHMLARQAALIVGISGLLITSVIETAPAATQAAQIWGAVATREPHTAGKRVTPPFLRLPQPDGGLREAAIAGVRQFLGPDAFDTAWAAGQALTIEQVVAGALAFVADAAIVDHTPPT